MRHNIIKAECIGSGGGGNDGIVAIGAIILLLTISGTDLVIKALSFKTYFLIATLLTLCILGLQMGALNFERILTTQETFGHSFGDAVWFTMIYIGFQAFTVLPIISVSQHIKTTRDCNWFMVEMVQAGKG